MKKEMNMFARKMKMSLIMQSLRLAFLMSGVLAECAAAQEGFEQSAKLSASTGAAQDNLGWSVATNSNGRSIVAGAMGSIYTGSTPGSAYLWDYSGGAWKETRLQGDGVKQADSFGENVSISGDGNTIVVGAPGWNSNADKNNGSAYVFSRSDGAWRRQKLVAGDGADGDWFGAETAVSNDGSLIVIAARNRNDLGEKSGCVYLFRKSSGTWSQVLKLEPSDGTAKMRFGDDVAVNKDGTVLVVGSSGIDFYHPLVGKAYAYRWNGSSWVEYKLSVDGLKAGDHYGLYVALSGDGNTAVVGAANDSEKAAYAGAAYVYRWKGGTWVSEKLTAATPLAYAGFGSGMSLSNDGKSMLVSASGVVYAYSYTKGAWDAGQQLIGSDTQSDDSYGKSGLSGDGLTAVAGACNDDDKGTDSGSVYVFRKSGAEQIPNLKVLKRLTAAITVNKSSGKAPLKVKFKGNASGPGKKTYYWDFDGDGTVDSNSRSVKYTYESRGKFKAALTVANGKKRSKTVKRRIVVK